MLEAASRLGELCDEMVFIGGCATGILITDQAAPEVRPTVDVDVIVEAVSRGEYYRIEKALQSKGFNQIMQDDSPICKWYADGVELDVMPTDPAILGFGNRWYGPALENAKNIILQDGLEVNMITAPYFLGTKMEAFLGRGNGDYYASHDLEDMIAVINGRPELIDEIENESDELKVYLSEKFNNLLQNESFIEALPGHLPPDPAGQGRLGVILERIQHIIDLNTKKSE
jgi:hypothetical protein